MLQKILVQNYALIDAVEINFSDKFTIITGETGAGKSILLGALSLILGERAESNVLFDKQNKCVVEGYVKPHSSKILTYSSGIIQGGNKVSFEVVFECDVCFPVEGMIIPCVAKNITKAGIRAESANDVPSPIVVFLAKDHHFNSAQFAEVQEGDKINVRVIGQRFELNDKYISIIAELVKV